MAVRLCLCIAFVAHLSLLVLCNDEHGTAIAPNDPESTLETSITSTTSKKIKCHKIKKCPINEKFTSCPESIQRPQYCSEKGQPCRQRTVDKESCKKGCVCRRGYLRADNGTCVQEEECPTTCGPNEIQDNCPANCESDYCPTSNSSASALCTTPDVCPPPVCKCRFNYRRAINGTCIPTRSCPPFDCSSKPNEEFVSCPPLCPTDDCSQASPSGECPPLIGNIGIVLPCSPKCRCIKGFWRLNGTCVPYGQCPGVCPENERYSECIQAECRALNCTQIDQSIPCPRIRPEFCRKGCVCEEGYLRNKNGICVKEKQCEAEVCPENERYSGCIQGECRALDCTQIGQSIPCPRIRPEFCRKGCVCEEGYLRNENGICVKEKQCEAEVCPENERYSGCIQGECRALDCTQIGQSIPCPRIRPEFCRKGCVCEEGYLRNENGDCVEEDQCEEETCPPNEQFSTCSQAECRTLDCKDRGKPVACPSIVEGSCIEKCVCKSGYLRAENGTCVVEEQCPPPTCVENEVLQNCSQYCTSDYCPSSADQEQTCYPPSPPDSCVPMCKCRFNYRRSNNGTCIPTRSCPPFDCSERPNEEYNPCPPICPSDACGKPRLTGRCPFRIGIVLICQPKCTCKDGYGRVNGTCVPFEECPDLCPTNEEYSPCTQKTCRPQTCSERNSVMENCSTCDDSSCKRGCVCKENYYRNDKGVCVPVEECEDD